MKSKLLIGTAKNGFDFAYLPTYFPSFNCFPYFRIFFIAQS